MVTVQINGQAQQLDGGQTVAAMVAAHGGDRRGVAVAVNGQVVPRREWEHALLSDGDDVLVVRPAAGG